MYLNKCPSDSMATKVQNVSNMIKNQLNSLITDGGLRIHSKPDHLIVIPAGVMLLQYAPKDSKTISYVRWSIYKKTDRVHVLEALETIMGSYAFLEPTDYKPLRDLMRVE